MINNTKINTLNYEYLLEAAKLYYAKNYKFRLYFFIRLFSALILILVAIFLTNYRLVPHSSDSFFESIYVFMVSKFNDIPIWNQFVYSCSFVVILLYGFYYKPIPKKRLKALAQTPQYKRQLLLKFDENTFTFYTELSDFMNTIKYSDLFFFKQNQSVILLGVTHSTYMILPTDWFDNEIYKNQFIEYCLNKIKKI